MYVVNPHALHTKCTIVFSCKGSMVNCVMGTSHFVVNFCYGHFDIVLFLSDGLHLSFTWQRLNGGALQPGHLVLIFLCIFTESRYKILSANEGDKQQLRSFYSACCGMAQVI